MTHKLSLGNPEAFSFCLDRLLDRVIQLLIQRRVEHGATNWKMSTLLDGQRGALRQPHPSEVRLQASAAGQRWRPRFLQWQDGGSDRCTGDRVPPLSRL